MPGRTRRTNNRGELRRRPMPTIPKGNRGPRERPCAGDSRRNATGPASSAGLPASGPAPTQPSQCGTSLSRLAAPVASLRGSRSLTRPIPRSGRRISPLRRRVRGGISESGTPPAAAPVRLTTLPFSPERCKAPGHQQRPTIPASSRLGGTIRMLGEWTPPLSHSLCFMVL